jgi:hypothetical protein
VISSESLFETYRKIQKEIKTEKVLKKQKSNIIVAQAGVSTIIVELLGRKDFLEV